MQNTFSQSGNDSKWFLTKIIFQNRYVALETPSRPRPPFIANAILNFHFDYWHPSLIINIVFSRYERSGNLVVRCLKDMINAFFSRFFVKLWSSSYRIGRWKFSCHELKDMKIWSYEAHHIGFSRNEKGENLVVMNLKDMKIWSYEAMKFIIWDSQGMRKVKI